MITIKRLENTEWTNKPLKCQTSGWSAVGSGRPFPFPCLGFQITFFPGISRNNLTQQLSLYGHSSYFIERQVRRVEVDRKMIKARFRLLIAPAIE
jgi:hypothetical protein